MPCNRGVAVRKGRTGVFVVHLHRAAGLFVVPVQIRHCIEYGGFDFIQIGAGGFGALVFQGLLSSALDLVLLGVVPTIALAVVVDALFALWGAWLKGEAND